eukprot:353950-Chlamydomonas_euryale.AAC.6
MLPRIRGSFTGNIEPTVIAEQNPDEPWVGPARRHPVHVRKDGGKWHAPCKLLTSTLRLPTCNEIGIVPNSTALLPFSSRRQRSRGVSVPSTASDTSSLGPIPSSLTPLTRPHECGGAWPTADVASSAPEAGELLSHPLQPRTMPASKRGRQMKLDGLPGCLEGRKRIPGRVNAYKSPRLRQAADNKVVDKQLQHLSLPGTDFSATRGGVAWGATGESRWTPALWPAFVAEVPACMRPVSWAEACSHGYRIRRVASSIIWTQSIAADM